MLNAQQAAKSSKQTNKQFPLIHAAALQARQSVWSLKIQTMHQIL